VAAQWLFCVTLRQDAREAPTFVPAGLAGAVAGATCIARLIVAFCRREVVGTDVALSCLLACVIACASVVILGRRAPSPHRDAAPNGGGGGVRARERKAWQAGFPSSLEMVSHPHRPTCQSPYCARSQVKISSRSTVKIPSRSRRASFQWLL
jgi:hypothetical protein